MRSDTFFPRYNEFVESGVEWIGRIPNNWSVGRLRHFVTVSPSKSSVGAMDFSKLVSFIPMEAIKTDGQVDLSSDRSLRDVYTGYTYVADGDVIVAKVTPCFENGKAALLTNLTNGIGFGTTEITVLRPSSKVVPKWLYYLFKCKTVIEMGKGSMYGVAGLQRVPDDFFRNLPTVLPPLPEQRAIAAFLDRETSKIDILIEKQVRLITFLNEKRKAIISHAVTKGLDAKMPMKDSGRQWLGMIPKHWQLKKLKYLAAFTSGGTPSKENLKFWDGVVPWASSKDLKTEYLHDTEDHITQYAVDNGAANMVEVGAILVVVRGMILAHTFPVTINLVPMSINQDLKAITPNANINAEYMAFALRGTSKETLARTSEAGHGTKALRMDTWLQLELPVPPRTEQQSICEFIKIESYRIQSLIAKAEQSIDLMKERRAALISAAVTGKIDVREVA